VPPYLHYERRHIPIKEYAKLQGYEYRTLITDIKLRKEYLDETQRLIDTLMMKGFIEVAMMHAKKRKLLIDDLKTADELLGRIAA